MLMAPPTSCEIDTEGSLLTVRANLRAAAVELGFGIVSQTKLVTAASELARNILRYAGRGTLDLELALQDGYSTTDSMGVGLSGARRLVDDFHIESELGKGTRVEITVWVR